jgi:methyl-accepting chemotaxis protein
MFNRIPILMLVVGGFVASTVALTIMVVITLDTIRTFEISFDRLAGTSDTVIAVNSDFEDMFEARLAALKYRATRDPALIDAVAGNIAEITSGDGWDGAVFSDDEIAAMVRGVRERAALYGADFDELANATITASEVLAVMSAMGREARQRLSEIGQTAYRDNDIEAAYRSGIVQEKLLLGRYYAHRFAMGKDVDHAERARAEFTAAKDEAQRLLRELQNPTRRQLATAVQDDIDSLLTDLDELQAQTLTAESIATDRLDVLGVAVQRDLEVQVNRMIEAQVALKDALGQKKDAAQSLVTGLGVGLIVFAILISILITIAMRKQFGSLVQKTEALADGNLEIEITRSTQKHAAARMMTALANFRDGEERRRIEASARAEEEKALLEGVLADLNASLKGLASGDLTVRLDTVGETRFAELRDNFNSATSRLEELISDVRVSAQSMENGVANVAAGAEQLAKRTENQAAAVNETTASVSQLKTSVATTSENAVRADGQVNDARAQTETGRGVVEKTVSAMSSIQKRANEITKIIATIDDIAFQTNLLALNAGVEAARAGEAGRGFAVVAAEVRGLAQRAGEAAQEIKNLITASVNEIERGARLADDTNTALERIVEAVDAVADAMSQIRKDTAGQAESITEISQAILELDSVTQQNAAMSEETTAAVIGLRNEAGQLRQQAGVFTVSSGGAGIKAGWAA